MRQNKYQITELLEDKSHAGSKAVQDARMIAEKLGYLPQYTRLEENRGNGWFQFLKRQLVFFVDWTHIFYTIQPNSYLFLQHPFRWKEPAEFYIRFLKKFKKIKVISLVHDVEALRSHSCTSESKKDYRLMLELNDALIVHNEKMKNWFVEQGVPNEKMIVLTIFDYLHGDSFDLHETDELPLFEKSISVAGNLDTYKSAYILRLGEIKNIPFYLYGPNFDKALLSYSNVIYKGCFPANQIPEKLKSGFGLVWDGNMIETCGGDCGNYLRYNNPHKLSLYLSCGLPVVIWKKAAEAKFVTEHNVGLCVDNLFELETVLEKVDELSYNEMAKNAMYLAKQLRNGAYLCRAIQEAEKNL